MSNVTVFGIRIQTDKTIATKEDIGLYAVTDQNSEFRWSDGYLVGVTESWTNNIIAKNGIPSAVRKLDTRRGGGIAFSNDISLRIVNTNQETLKIKELCGSLNGFVCELIEFVGTDSDSDSISRTIIYSGTIENVTWDIDYATINIKASLKLRRNSNILSNKASSPVAATFGLVNRAKVVKTNSELTEIENNVIREGTQPEGTKFFKIRDYVTGVNYANVNVTNNTFTTGYHGFYNGMPIRCDSSTPPGGIAQNKTYYVIVVSYDTFKLATTYQNAIDGIAVDITSQGSGWLPFKLALPQVNYLLTVSTTGLGGAGWSDKSADNLYLKVLSGNCKDQYRKITKWAQGDWDGASLAIEIAEVFDKEDLAVDDYVSIVRKTSTFELDVWPCAGFTDDSGNNVTNPEIYTYEDQYLRAPLFGLGLKADSNNNKLEINPTHFADDDSVDSMLILPLTDARTEFADDLTEWGLPDHKKTSDWGWYEVLPRKVEYPSIGIASQSVDGYGTTSTSFSVETDLGGSGANAAIALLYKMPVIPEWIDIDSVEAYIMIHLKQELNIGLAYTGNYSENVRVVLDLPFGNVDAINVSRSMPNGTTYSGGVSNMPNLYAGHVSDFDKNFYRDFSASNSYLKSGYSTLGKIDLPITELIRDIKQIAFILQMNSNYYFELNADLYEIALGFKFKQSIKKEVFSPAKGRIFNSCWDISEANWSGGEKEKTVIDIRSSPPAFPATGSKYLIGLNPTGAWVGHSAAVAEYSGTAWIYANPAAGNLVKVGNEDKTYIYDNSAWRAARKSWYKMIEDPVDIIEHCLRLQNWNETGDKRDWGKSYSPNAEIRLTGSRGFDNSALADVRARRPARQILDESKAFTSDLIKSLCDSFYLVQSQDSEGYECITYLFNNSEPVANLTFRDMDDISDMIEPRAEDIFLEPYINYAFDSASNEYTKQLSINNISAETWQADYTPGFEGTDGQAVWEACHAQLSLVRQIEPMPKSMADQPWIVTYEDALWKINKMLLWQKLRRCSFSVAYENGRYWDVGYKISISLPHQTDGQAIDCMIEEIKLEPDKAKVNLKVVLLEDIPTTFFFE